MGRRRGSALGDEYADSSDDDGGSGLEDDEMEGGDPDLAEEMRLFRDPSRKRRKFTKDDAIYGIFGGDRSDDEGADTSRNARMQKGMRFVKSTQHQQKPSEIVSSAAGSIPNSRDDKGDDGNDVDDDDDMDVEAEIQVDDIDDDEAEVKARQPRNREEEESEEEDDANTPFRAGLGGGLGMSSNPMMQGMMGFGNQRGGLGFSSDAPQKSSSASSKNSQRAGLGSSSQSSRHGLVSSQPPASTTGPSSKDEKKQPASKAIHQELYSQKPEQVDRDFAKFEKLNKGIGLKYLMKMGYKVGEGLGKGGAGIVEPIDVKLRPKMMGLGHKGFDETTKAQKKLREKVQPQFVLSDDEEESAKPKVEKETQQTVEGWKKSKKSRKMVYRTAEDFIKEQESALEQAATQPPTKTKIIDMTGREAKELQDMSEAASASHLAAVRSAGSHLMELRYNLRMLLGESETDLIRLTKALSLEKKAVAHAIDEEKVISRRLEEQRGRKQRIEEVVVIAKQFAEAGKRLMSTTTVHAAKPGGKQLLTAEMIDSELMPHVQTLHEKYWVEYQEQQLDHLVIATMTPLLKRLFANWSPFLDPLFSISYFRKWSQVFRSISTHSRQVAKDVPNKHDWFAEVKKPKEKMAAFDNMLYNVWLPKVRQAVNGDWSTMDSDPFISLIEAWYPSSPAPEIIIVNKFPMLATPNLPHILPPWLHSNIIVHLILPKLKNDIETYDIKRSTIPLHTWLFPWLPVLVEQFESLHDTIRLKLSSAVSELHPSKSEVAVSLLKPWEEILLPSEIEGIINRAVLPKLVAVLRHEFTVNPANQDNSPLVWVLQWQCSMLPSTLCHLLETEFFPKWINVLHAWLSSPNVAMAEVSKWYMAWKTFFPLDIVNLEGVSDAFKVGFDLMASVFKKQPISPIPPRIIPIAERSVTDTAKNTAKFTSRKDRDVRAGMPELMRKKALDTGFQDLLERTAASNGRALLPTTRTHASGRPIFRIVRESADVKADSGGTLFYIDEGVLFVYQGGAVGDSAGTWSPASIDDLMKLN